jgi:hypothetical protein
LSGIEGKMEFKETSKGRKGKMCDLYVLVGVQAGAESCCFSSFGLRFSQTCSTSVEGLRREDQRNNKKKNT